MIDDTALDVQDEPIEEPVGLRKDVKDAFALLERQVQELVASARPVEDAPHFVYGFPVRDTKEVDPSIYLKRATGAEAWNLAMEAYGRFHLLEGQHPMATFRLPGIIYVENLDEILPIVEDINTTKKILETLVTSVPSSARHKFTYETLPGAIMLQVYRKIVALPESARRFVFTWAKRTTGSETLSISQALALVREAVRLKTAKEGDLFPQVSMAQLKSEITLLEALYSDQALQIYRPIAPHPRLVAFDKEGTVKPFLQYHANLPILTHLDPATQIRPLPDFDWSGNAPKKRKDAKQRTLLIPRLHLYTLDE